MSETTHTSSLPNILLINVDQWSGRLLQEAGHPVLLTPTLDQLARNGIRYTNAYASVPVCIAARRSLMTGTTPRVHGDRSFNETLEMPSVPTVAQAFRDAGYQAYAVGKLHVYPQRDRIGFDDVILHEEGRYHFGMRVDDYEYYLAQQGYAGLAYAHGMGNNSYTVRPWHLPEHLHPTCWTAREICHQIKRRDLRRPSFWYVSFNFPHPPIVPPRDYLEIYRHREVDQRIRADWSEDFEHLPYGLKWRFDRQAMLSSHELAEARRGYYAQCTYIDHQIRLIIGTLREEDVLDNTIICFVSDHGDMLGNHRLFEKRTFYEDSARVHLILIPPAGDSRHHQVDDRLAGLEDVMPTLLEMAGISIPETVEGRSLLSDERRSVYYGEWGEGEVATRMIRNERYKLIYYPTGNRSQLFDLQSDPNEQFDLSNDPAFNDLLESLQQVLISHLYGGDEVWVHGEKLVGLQDKIYTPQANRGLNLQRGWHL